MNEEKNSNVAGEITGVAWVQCIGVLDPLRCCHVFNFVQLLDIWQYFNCPILLYTVSKFFPKLLAYMHYIFG